MNVTAWLQNLEAQFLAVVPGIIGAAVILIIGWILASIVRSGVQRLLHALKLNERMRGEGEEASRAFDVVGLVGALVYWLILLLALVGALGVLHVDAAIVPLDRMLSKVTFYLPDLFAGLVLVGIAYVVAKLVRSLSLKPLSMLRQRHLGEGTSPELENALANVLFWLVILFFLPAILGALRIDGAITPVQEMTAGLLAAVPRIFAGLVIAVVGWIIASILRALTRNLATALGVDQAAARMGIEPRRSLAHSLGTLVFIVVFLPALIAALQALHIDAISQPATLMLQEFFVALPHILAAILILLVTWFVARFIVGVIAELTAGAGLDQLPQRVGLGHLFSEQNSASRVLARVLFFFAMLFATTAAAEQLGFTAVEHLVALFINFAGQILLGSVILMVGFWLASLAQRSIAQSGEGNRTLYAEIARFAILGLVLAMGLRAMGIADDIVNLAFGLTLGAVAVAVALSFGLGGREAAGRFLNHWLDRLLKRSDDPSNS
ncbi:MAG: mechanosensitive ion channel [Acidithiobacillus sp.]|uniref:mechanosensitive ion channel n=1 Tax=Acidithiobacillus sp. TaxID=1872118 RepID=UPI003CFD291D